MRRNPSHRPQPLKPRILSWDEMQERYDAATRRPAPKPDNWIELAIKKRNSYRLWRLRYDYKWLRKEYKRLGLNPDDAHNLLQ